jgi:hypothetical protein
MTQNKEQQAPALKAVAAQKPLTAIQIVEQNVAQYTQQVEQAMAQLHATQGALHATQVLLTRLKNEELKAAAAATTAGLNATKDAVQDLSEKMAAEVPDRTVSV